MIYSHPTLFARSLHLSQGCEIETYEFLISWGISVLDGKPGDLIHVMFAGIFKGCVGSYSYRTWSDNDYILILLYIYIYIYVLLGVGKVSLKVATRGGSSCYNIFMDPCFACSHLQGQDPKFPKQDTRPGHSDSCPVVKVCPCCCEGQNISKWVQISYEPSCSTSEWPLCEECTIAELQKYVQGS